MSCPFKHALGVPGEGVHAPRLFGLARNDTIATLVAAFLFTAFWSIPLWKSAVGLFAIGEILHWMFGTQTAFLTLIGVRACS